MKLQFALAILLLFFINNSLAQKIDSAFLNPNQIILSKKHIIEISKAELQWGNQLIKTLDFERLNSVEKAKK